MSTNPKRFKYIQTTIIALTSVLIAINFFFLFIYSMSRLSKIDLPILEPGTQFESFREHLKGVDKIGYLTNKDSSPEKNDGAYLQAQYYFAPMIIELNNNHHRFNVIDYEEPMFIIYVFNDLKARRVANNEYGQALAERKSW